MVKLIRIYYFSNMSRIAIGIIEDDPIMRRSLENFLGGNPAFSVVLVADSVENGLKKLQRGIVPEILLLDIQLPGLSGIEGVPLLKRVVTKLEIIILTTFEASERIFAALCAGACSYVSKRTSIKKIEEVIHTVHRGGSYMSPSVARKIATHLSTKPEKNETALTARQMDIIQASVDGLSYKMAAEKLGISIDTVRTHIKHIYRALNINSKAQLIRKAIKGELN